MDFSSAGGVVNSFPSAAGLEWSQFFFNYGQEFLTAGQSCST